MNQLRHATYYFLGLSALSSYNQNHSVITVSLVFASFMFFVMSSILRLQDSRYYKD